MPIKKIQLSSSSMMVILLCHVLSYLTRDLTVVGIFLYLSFYIIVVLDLKWMVEIYFDE